MTAAPPDSPEPASPASPAPGPPRLSRLAVASLLLGMWSFATLLLLGIVPAAAALVCGHVALIKIQHSRGRLRGRLVALAGLIAAYATVLLTPALAIAAAVAWPLLTGHHQQQQERIRLDHAAALYRACESHARDQAGRYPETWEELAPRYLGPGQLAELLRPRHDTLAESWRRQAARLAGREPAAAPPPAYLLIPHERPVLRELEGSVLVLREVAPPDVERVAAAYDNGATALMANPDRD